MEQSTQTAYDGSQVSRWWVKLDSGKEVVTWASDEAAALAKVARRGAPISVRPAGNPLEDRPR